MHDEDQVEECGPMSESDIFEMWGTKNVLNSFVVCVNTKAPAKFTVNFRCSQTTNIKH